VRQPTVSPLAYRRIALFALVALGVIIVTGAAVRLTGSGPGCSDWPNCTDNHFVASSDFHERVEFGNRLFTGVVSVAVMLAVLGSLVRSPRRRDLTWWSLGLVGGVFAQALLGAIVVKQELTPPIVMAHFLLSMVLMWNATVLLQRASEGPGRAVAIVRPLGVWLGRCAVVVAAAVLFAGTVVTGTGPHGGDEHVERLSFDITEVARIHAVLAWALLALLIVAFSVIYRGGATEEIRRRGAVVVAAVLVQGGIGYTQYFTGVPPWLVAIHVLGSVVVWVSVLRFHLGLFARGDAATDVRPSR
jgi:heme a synthase